MKPSLKRSGLALLAVSLLALAGTLPAQTQPQSQSPALSRSRAEDTLDLWNEIGNKLVAMAQDFPEDKYDFKVQKDERTFAQNLLHVAAVDYIFMRRISGSNLGPDLDAEGNPSRDVYKTKADVVKRSSRQLPTARPSFNSRATPGSTEPRSLMESSFAIPMCGHS
jgi:hypothetical protein